MDIDERGEALLPQLLYEVEKVVSVLLVVGRLLGVAAWLERMPDECETQRGESAGEQQIEIRLELLKVCAFAEWQIGVELGDRTEANATKQNVAAILARADVLAVAV